MIRGTDVKFTAEEQGAMMARLRDVVESNFFMWGDQQEEFQIHMAGMTGRKYAMTYSHVTQATEAIFDILFNWKTAKCIVAFQGNQFPSVMFAAQRQAYDIEWVDVQPESMAPALVDVERMYRQRKFDVLVLQHTGGFITDEVESIAAWCKANKVFFLEDASQAMGTFKEGWAAGHWGDISVISLSATKFLTTGGQGGIVLFDDKSLWDPLFQRKVYGRSEMFQKGDWVTKGWNCQMTEMQAAVGNALFPFLDGWIAHRRKIADVYEQLFDDTSLRPCGHRSDRPNWYKYPVMLPPDVDRQQFKEYLLAQGVQCSSEIYSQPTYSMGSFGGEFSDVSLPGSEKFSRHHVCLPMHNAMSMKDAEPVGKAL